ncbi:MAG: hypothetical protein LRY54_04575 [Alphaproteobacteria bacterium]|nr:hypothetical protein [Alphaproteobacteria bacterium]
MPSKDENLGNMGSFFEPLCYLAYQAKKSGNEELEKRIQICVDYLYDKMNDHVPDLNENL